MNLQKKIHVYLFLPLRCLQPDRQIEEQNIYRINAHRLEESEQKKSDLYFNQRPRISRFPLNVADKRTDDLRTFVITEQHRYLKGNIISHRQKQQKPAAEERGVPSFRHIDYTYINIANLYFRQLQKIITYSRKISFVMKNFTFHLCYL